MLAAIETLPARRAWRQYLQKVAVEHTVCISMAGSPNVELINLYQSTLDAATAASGHSLSAAELQVQLSKKGQKGLARRVERLARSRHSAAHPDLTLPQQVSQVLAGEAQKSSQESEAPSPPCSGSEEGGSAVREGLHEAQPPKRKHGAERTPIALYKPVYTNTLHEFHERENGTSSEVNSQQFDLSSAHYDESLHAGRANTAVNNASEQITQKTEVCMCALLSCPDSQVCCNDRSHDNEKDGRYSDKECKPVTTPAILHEMSATYIVGAGRGGKHKVKNAHSALGGKGTCAGKPNVAKIRRSSWPHANVNTVSHEKESRRLLESATVHAMAVRIGVCSGVAVARHTYKRFRRKA